MKSKQTLITKSIHEKIVYIFKKYFIPLNKMVIFYESLLTDFANLICMDLKRIYPWKDSHFFALLLHTEWTKAELFLRIRIMKWAKSKPISHSGFEKSLPCSQHWFSICRLGKEIFQIKLEIKITALNKNIIIVCKRPILENMSKFPI